MLTVPGVPPVAYSTAQSLGCLQRDGPSAAGAYSQTGPSAACSGEQLLPLLTVHMARRLLVVGAINGWVGWPLLTVRRLLTAAGPPLLTAAGPPTAYSGRPARCLQRSVRPLLALAAAGPPVACSSSPLGVHALQPASIAHYTCRSQKKGEERTSVPDRPRASTLLLHKRVSYQLT